jgi:hypothetical protein
MMRKATTTTDGTATPRGSRHDWRRRTSGASTKLSRIATAIGTKISWPAHSTPSPATVKMAAAVDIPSRPFSTRGGGGAFEAERSGRAGGWLMHAQPTGHGSGSR